jgi:hypothetical protein
MILLGFRMTENDEMKQAIDLIKTGDKASGGALLRGLLKHNRNNALAWLWLSACFEKNEDRIYCLEQVLRINPDHQAARNALDKIRQSQPARAASYSAASYESYAPPAAQPAPVYYTPQTSTSQPASQPATTVDFMARAGAGRADWRRRDFKARPWYRSNWAYIIYFLISPLLWAIFVLTDEDKSIVSKVVASLFGIMNLLYLGSMIVYFFVHNIPPSGPHVVEYRIEGTAAKARILYNDGSGSLFKYTAIDTRPPWRLTYHMPSNSNPVLTAENSTNQGTVSCTIIVDGQVISNHASYTSAQCRVALP